MQVVDENVSAITTGGGFSLFIKADGSLWGMGKMNLDSWGRDKHRPSSPVKVLDENVSQISTGLEHTMFIKTDGSLWGMGKIRMAD